MFVARLGVAAGADIRMAVVEADVPKEEAHHGEKKTEEKAGQINILFHRRNPFNAGQLTRDIIELAESASLVTYKLTPPFVTGANWFFVAQSIEYR
jgi:hypothetical protein